MTYLGKIYMFENIVSNVNFEKFFRLGDRIDKEERENFNSFSYIFMCMII